MLHRLCAVIAAVNMILPFAAASPDHRCEIGDTFCESIQGTGSYCKYWLFHPVCHGSLNSSCSCREDVNGFDQDNWKEKIKNANQVCRNSVLAPSYCRFWDEIPTCHGAPDVQCLPHRLVESQSPDACDFSDARLVSDNVWATSLSSVKTCVESTTITHAQALWTLHNLLYGVSEGYSYTKLAANSTLSTFDNDCDFKIHNISVDIEEELKSQIGQYTRRLENFTTLEDQTVFLRATRPAFPFHSSLVRLFNDLRDAHTAYTSPYSMISLFFPFGLDSYIGESGGDQIITVRFADTDSLRTVATVYESVYNVSLPLHLHGGKISSINDMSPLEFITQQADSSNSFDCMLKGLNQRINRFFFTEDTISINIGNQVWSNYDSIKLVIEDPKTKIPVPVTLQLVARIVPLGDSSWSPNESNISFNEAINTNIDFSKFEQYDFKKDLNTTTLWRLTSSTADKRRRDQESSSASQPTTTRRLLQTDNFSTEFFPDSSDYEIMQNLDSRSKYPFGANPTKISAPSSSLTAQFSNDTVIVRIPSFFVHQNKSSETYFEEMIRVQSIAKSLNVSKIVIDVSGNPGGIIPASNALSWFFLDNVADICHPVAKRMTWNWRSWFQSFGDSGVSDLLNNFELEGGLSELGRLYREILREIETFLEFRNHVLRTDSALIKQQLYDLQILCKSMIMDEERGKAIVDFFLISDTSEGLYPLWTGEVCRIDGFDDHPNSKIYTDLETVKWGNEFSQITQKRPFKACVDTLKNMEKEFGSSYDRNFWTRVAIVSDGGCGSACSQFVTGMQLSGKATVFTYGGIASMEMDASAFTGGSVSSYDVHWRRVSVSERLGDLITLGKSEWSRLHADTWIHSPTPFPHKAKATFNWNMMFFLKLGQNSLPREYYEIPSHKHLALWAHDDDGMQKIYQTIITTDWDMIKGNHICQAKGHGPQFTI